MPEPADDAPSVETLRAHAAFHASESTIGIGAAVVRSRPDGGDHVWECMVSDGHEWRYIQVIGLGVGRAPDLSSENIEQGIERFAATLPEPDRLRAVVNANPLHVDRQGTVTD
jgi:hypothetical protein